MVLVVELACEKDGGCGETSSLSPDEMGIFVGNDGKKLLELNLRP